ncbi:late embryogenesis abundant protein At5g17165-like [Cynara cardunculus var. scolymus]|uniref:late embryogenesis abundant protein At5g17165-like n=1 Tax=Cynara cardunculus var. scolymus TaxID=59895 RepID=UPI000D627DE9|nr:late embryogenesis abundant protein At5g17165-like [Cynara cardunculus var. scolymus]
MAGKHIINHLQAATPSPSLCFSSFSTFRRRLHESAYEKQVDYEVRVPPRVEDQQYWEPDPETGVFVPHDELKSEEAAVTCTTEETVLDEKAFFRPVEDLEAPAAESFTGEIPPVDPFAEEE